MTWWQIGMLAGVWFTAFVSMFNGGLSENDMLRLARAIGQEIRR